MALRLPGAMRSWLQSGKMGWALPASSAATPACGLDRSSWPPGLEALKETALVVGMPLLPSAVCGVAADRPLTGATMATPGVAALVLAAAAWPLAPGVVAPASTLGEAVATEPLTVTDEPVLPLPACALWAFSTPRPAALASMPPPTVRLPPVRIRLSATMVPVSGVVRVRLVTPLRV